MLKNKEFDIVYLYNESKLSMAQIANLFGLSVSTIRYYLDKHNIKRRTISEAIIYINKTKFKKEPFKLKEKFSWRDKELKIAGIMLYWGEGNKSGNVAQFTNSDSEMIKLFLNFLRNICGISEKRLKALVHIYSNQDRKFVENFWIKTTGIPKMNFYPSHIHKGKKGTYKNKSVYGTIAISYPDKQLLRIILNWIEDYKRKLAISQDSSVR